MQSYRNHNNTFKPSLTNSNQTAKLGYYYRTFVQLSCNPVSALIDSVLSIDIAVMKGLEFVENKE